MGWASGYIKKLLDGETIKCRPRGNSMKGKINSGQLCTIMPLEKYDPIKVGDIVLCKVRGNEYLHLVKAVNGERYMIGNNFGKINGWVGRSQIFGVLVNVEN
jgi:hypothetical protein